MRTVLGSIKEAVSGAPISSARVRVWDADSPDSDDLMGSASTNSNGEYAVEYQGGKSRWDQYIPGTTTWRPDIYITVDVSVDGAWFRVHKSGIRSNHKLREDLRLDATVVLPRSDARAVSGIVRWQKDSSPVVGAKILVRDADFGTAAQEMGSSRTDTRGEYEVRYRGGHWDPAPHSTGSWRPDVFVEVHVPDSSGKYQEVWESRIYHDHPHSEPLRIDAYVRPPRERPTPAPTPTPTPGTGGSIARITNRASAIRYLYVNGEYRNRLFPRQSIDVTVPCGKRFVIQAKDRLSDVFNNVTFVQVVPGLCLEKAVHLSYEIRY